jgi:hypothetical protein
MKKLLLVLMLCTFAFACTEEKDETVNNTTIEETSSANYAGTITVGEGSGAFSEDSISIETKLSSGKMNAKLLQVKFAQAMPLRIDMEINGIDYVKQNTGSYTLTGNNIIPIVMDVEYPSYTITNLSGTIINNVLSLSMTCGSYPVIYVGTLK